MVDSDEKFQQHVAATRRSDKSFLVKNLVSATEVCHRNKSYKICATYYDDRILMHVETKISKKIVQYTRGDL